MTLLARLLVLFLLLFGLVGCANTQKDCPITKPVWAKPSADAAIPDAPAYSYYFINEDQSIWASAGWTGIDSEPLRVRDEGFKVGWFRPAGATLEVTGQRLDAKAPPLESDLSCCYPTRFQASGIYIPTEGCWEINAKAEGKELSFVIWVEPKDTSP